MPHLWGNSVAPRSYILDASGKEIRNLPVSAPEKGAVAFSTWHWLDSNTLIATSGIEKVDRNGGFDLRGEEPNMDYANLYIYHLSEDKMQKVDLPDTLKVRFYHIKSVIVPNKVELGTDNEGYQWFEIRNI